MNEQTKIPTSALLSDRPVVLVGLMGSGKSTLGHALAAALAVDFVDADEVIVAAQGMAIAQIFAQHGEDHFRAAERSAIAGLISGRGSCVIATGGGAFINPDTRALIREKALSVWIKADLDTLVTRTAGDESRPLLQTGDARATLAGLIDKRYPIYAQADITVETGAEPADMTLNKIIDALRSYAGTPRRD